MSLLELVRTGDAEGVLRALAELTPAQRAENAVALAACRAEVADAWYRRPCQPRLNAQLAAELGCCESPSDADAWLRGENWVQMRGDGGDAVWPVAVVGLRSIEWRVELIGLLADRVPRERTFVFAFLEHLVHDTGCPVPTTDAFVTAWLIDRVYHYRERPAHLSGGVVGEDFVERLRADPWADQLLPLVVSRLEVHPDLLVLAGISRVRPDLVDRDELAALAYAEAGEHAPRRHDALKVMDLTPAEQARIGAPRTELLDRCLERFLAGVAGPWLDLVRVLAPTPAEHAALARDHLALLDGVLPVAEFALETLAGLDEAGLVEPELLDEACERVLLRPEKKLVRAQLAWLDRAAKRDPARAGQVVIAAATAFGHRDAALQGRALAVVARHLAAAGDAVLPELRTAVERLGPAESARVAELFGTSVETAVERVADVLPAVPEPRAVPGPLETVAEVAEEVAAVVAGDRDVVVFERALDGLVRHAHLDRAALGAALRPVVRKDPGWESDCRQADLYDVARAVLAEEPRRSTVAPENRRGRMSLAGKVLRARLVDAIDAVDVGARPFLLATPTLSTGALDPTVLLERLAAYEELGVVPGEVDLAQAWLRVTPTTDQRVLAAAGLLESDAGKRTADWLRTGGLPHQESRPENWESGPPERPRWMWWSPATPGPPSALAVPEDVALLIGPRERRNSHITTPPRRFWFAQLPHHRDEVAARDCVGYDRPGRGWTAALPFVAESGGPAGHATHLVLALGALVARPDEHGPVVDAVLVLAARGQLDAALLGRQIAVLVRDDWGWTNRLAETLRAAAGTGAPGVVWAVLEGALPGLLRDQPVRGAGELLAVAVECASRCGASGGIAEVTAVAERRGSSLVVKNARRLRDVLARAGG
jgi:hypothetical protein